MPRSEYDITKMRLRGRLEKIQICNRDRHTATIPQAVSVHLCVFPSTTSNISLVQATSIGCRRTNTSVTLVDSIITLALSIVTSLSWLYWPVAQLVKTFQYPWMSETMVYVRFDGIDIAVNAIFEKIVEQITKRNSSNKTRYTLLAMKPNLIMFLMW